MYKYLSSPIRIDLELTAKCNLKCNHCYNYWRDCNDHLPQLSLKDLKRILDQVEKRQVFEITATGGEPFLNPEVLLYLIKHCRRTGTTLTINSNLTIIHSEIIDIIEKQRIGLLTSLHSYREAQHDKIVGRKGSFAKTVNNIKDFINRRIPVAVNMVLRQDNFDDLYKTGDYVHDLGVKTFSAVRVSPPIYAKNISSIVLNKEQVRKSLDILLELHETLRLRTGNQNCYPLCLLGDTKKYKKLTLRKCGAGAYHCAVGADGSVRPCAQNDRIYGNILSENLSEVWNKMEDWHFGKYIPDKCRDCQYLLLCSTGCRSDSFIATGSLNGPDPYSSSPDDVIPYIEQPYRPKLNINDTLFLPRLRFRDENFGVIVCPFSRQSNNTIVKKETANILRALQEKEFSIEGIVNEYDIDRDNAINFFTELAERRLLIRRKTSEQ